MLEIRVLGPVELAADGAVVSLPLQQRRLIAALATQLGETRSTDELLDAMWAEEQPRSGAKAVQIYVSRLRRALGSSAAIRTSGHGYALDLERVSVDAMRFEQLVDDARQAMSGGNPLLARSLVRRGLDLWRGQAYGDLAYEDWARSEADRLEELRKVGLEEWLTAELELGRHRELLPEIRRLAREHPTREGLQALTMLALYRCGRQSEALAVYGETRVRLREEFGLEPGPVLRELERRILQHDPQLAAPEPTKKVEMPPRPPSGLIGRRRELQELLDLLLRQEARLVVLTGPGGSGKTVLALEVARQAAASYANGAAFVDLSALRDPRLVLGAIGRAIGVELTEQPLEALLAALGAREQLLVLDNVEQLRAAGPEFVELLKGAPRVSLLATSRERLNVSGEQDYLVPTLPLEDAVELFAQRARQMKPHFQPDEHVTEIAHRLDGLPLALELAAARVISLTPRQIVERLGESLELLTGGARDAPERQRALRATIEWSYQLLEERECVLFARLAVFIGGWTLEAAEQVAGAQLDVLQSLVEKNLVASSKGRFWMLETIRQLACERLDPVDHAELERRHAEYFLALGEKVDSLSGEAREVALQLLPPELDNLRAAITWALRSDPNIALRLAWVAERFQPTARELRVWLDKALTLRGEVPAFVRARALHAAAHVAGLGPEVGRSRELWKQALDLYRQVGDEVGSARALAGLGLAAAQEGDAATARALYAESLRLYRSLRDARGWADPGDERRWGEWIVTNNLGELERASGNYGRAKELLEHAVAVATALGEVEQAAMSLHGLGDVALEQKQADVAADRYREAIALSAPLADGRRIIAWALAGLASAAGADGEADRAGLLWGAAQSLEEQLALPLPPHDRERYARTLKQLDRSRLQAAIAEGRTLSFDEAVEHALA
ncbi:MAG TPA: BTAD domain-containing putative transcriptional regulator [Gaiellaceae bacterium]|jgi:predicted ATPase/DNA-binding SARP family transcriptional activator|nr:BTAD domain-containing putative transcriptional regulator [Gaiellaceae bacterium]